MPKSPNQDQILEFLKQPENLGPAWDIADKLPDIVNELNFTFWRRLREIIAAGLDPTLNWEAALVFKDYDGFRQERWPGLYIAPKNRGRFFCGVSLQQELSQRDRNRLFGKEPPRLEYGIGWNDNVSGELRGLIPPEADNLAEILAQEGFARHDDWGWLALGTLNFTLRSRGDVLTLATGSTIEEQIAAKLLDLLTNHRGRIESIDSAIAADERR